MNAETALSMVLIVARERSEKNISRPKLKVGCPVAARDHRESPRIFAHVRHLKGTICLHRDFEKLPDQHKFGILAHELGHLHSRSNGEAEADLWVERSMGIDIKYRDSIQWISFRAMGLGR